MVTRIILILCAVVMAGCSGSALNRALPNGVPSITRTQFAGPNRAASPAFEHLFSFNDTNGAQPEGGLVELGGALYGTTQLGGDSGCFGGYSTPGCGTVFTVSTAGKEVALYSFKGEPDGAISWAPLISANGKLFGTTIKGGNSPCDSSDNVPGCGTVFEITPSGGETVLHSFQGGSDGATPSFWSPLVFVKGAIYGVTEQGGANNAGTFFRVTMSGKESVLYSFKAQSSESDPRSIVFSNGAFYGVSFGQGRTYSPNYGSVFRVTMLGKEKIIHSFQGAPDGANPTGQLVASGNMLYGVTTSGGTGKCYPYGCGTVFGVTIGGKERVLHRFDYLRTADGALPYSGLVLLHGALYGATASGGEKNNDGGVVFKVTTSGAETILYRFGLYDRNGTSPDGGVTAVGNTLYGTTSYGGKVKSGNKVGYGTVFKLRS
ncbi:MAG: choice-of-anchor tandem repeat GloVer-containing protein [Candidatus Cybelea sp.]